MRMATAIGCVFVDVGDVLLASHVWQPDHNGFTHQDLGFPEHVINKNRNWSRSG
jgi:phosphoketolase